MVIPCRGPLDQPFRSNSSHWTTLAPLDMKGCLIFAQSNIVFEVSRPKAINQSLLFSNSYNYPPFFLSLQSILQRCSFFLAFSPSLRSPPPPPRRIPLISHHPIHALWNPSATFPDKPPGLYRRPPKTLPAGAKQLKPGSALARALRPNPPTSTATASGASTARPASVPPRPPRPQRPQRPQREARSGRTMSYEKAVQRGTRVETFKRQQTESEAARSTKSQFRTSEVRRKTHGCGCGVAFFFGFGGEGGTLFGWLYRETRRKTTNFGLEAKRLLTTQPFL